MPKIFYKLALSIRQVVSLKKKKDKKGEIKLLYRQYYFYSKK
jgi:hypothetical protein